MRPTVHPLDPEFRQRAISWGRRERLVEAAYCHGQGPVIALGFERQSNARMREGFAALERAEAERRRAEDARMAWCEDDSGEWCD